VPRKQLRFADRALRGQSNHLLENDGLQMRHEVVDERLHLPGHARGQLAGWKHAGADLPRLAEAKALRARLGASMSQRGRPPGSPAHADKP
jgi:hypothetical protein